jgi:hypothetical protein
MPEYLVFNLNDVPGKGEAAVLANKTFRYHKKERRHKECQEEDAATA